MEKKVMALIVVTFVCITLILGVRYLEKQDLKKPVDNNSNETNEIDKLMNDMTLEEKIGQMLIVGYNSTEMNKTLEESLKTNKPGGFILFKYNFNSYDSTLKLINDIKATSEIPMFISVDQEGGLVQRLNQLRDNDVTIIPNMSVVGNKNDTTLTENLGKVIAEELKVFGININFAPVVDVNNIDGTGFIGTRSFGSDPNVVSSLALSLAKGMSDNGVIPVYKHFPGHGSTVTDSHYDLPVLNKTKEELIERDLIPFKDAISNDAKVIMIGHLAVPNLTNDNVPASLNKKVITDLLKNELGYKGLVVTDALNMGALQNNYTEKEIYEMAINAGVDILLMPTSSRSAINSIKLSIEEGKITTKQIDDSVRKILELKFEKLNDDKNLDRSYLGSSEHKLVVDSFK